jgi:tetratricopeptide (TPR) repeat protein
MIVYSLKRAGNLVKEYSGGVERLVGLLGVLCIASAITVGQSSSDPAMSARAAFVARNYSQSVKLYEQALAGHPDSAQLQSDLGLAYQMEGEHSLAIRSYLAALHLEDLPRTRELLTIERCRLREYSEARPLLARIAGHLSKDDALLPVLSPCYLEADDALDAIRVGQFLALSGIMPPDQVLVYRSHAFMAASNFFIGRLAQIQEGTPYLQVLKAARDAGSADARGAFPSATSHSSYLHSDLTLDEGLALFPKHSSDPALLYMLSVLAGEQAMQSISECETNYPASPLLAQFRAQLLTAQGQYQAAGAIFTQLLSSHPELPDLRHEAAMLYRGQGEWERALALFYDDLAANPSDGRAVTGISESLVQLGRYDEVVEFLVPHFSSAPGPLWAALDLSLAYQKLEKYPQAIHALSRAEKTYPHEKSIHFRLMRLYTLTGQTNLAQKESALFAGVNHP